MGNVCPNNCLYSCCDVNYYCSYTTRTSFIQIENCYYYYYDYAWVYWVSSIVAFFIFFFFFLWICICIRRRRNLALGLTTNQPMIVDTSATARSPISTNHQYMYDGNIPYNQSPQNYNGQQMYNTNQFPNAYNPNQYNRNVIQGTLIYYLRPTNSNRTKSTNIWNGGTSLPLK